MIMPSKRALARVNAPATEPLTLAETKLYLRIDGSEEDTLITELIASARQYAEDYLRRSLITQRWKLSFDDYAPDDAALPRGPVQGIVSVTAYARDDSATLIPPSSYYLNAAKDALLFDTTVYGHRIEIVYDTGFGLASAVPSPVKYGMLAHIAALYEQRGDADYALLPRQAVALYAPFREVGL